jgi:hypothetical protein
VELEFHQLALRYEGLRKRHPAQERSLLGSLAELGQQSPIVVVSEPAGAADRFVLIDGYNHAQRPDQYAALGTGYRYNRAG